MDTLILNKEGVDRQFFGFGSIRPLLSALP